MLSQLILLRLAVAPVLLWLPWKTLSLLIRPRIQCRPELIQARLVQMMN